MMFFQKKNSAQDIFLMKDLLVVDSDSKKRLLQHIYIFLRT